MFAYRPKKFNKGELFKEIPIALSKTLKCYDNVVLAGDLNFDLIDPSKDTSDHLCDLWNVFTLRSLVKERTCFMSHKGSLIDIILTKEPRSFYKIQAFVTGISDFQKLVVIVLTSYKKLPPKNIFYRNVKRFEKKFYNNCQEPYDKVTQIFSEVLDYHVPVKQKVVRRNPAPFMTKDLSKTIMMESKAENQYVKWPSWKKVLTFKKAKNKCTSINKKAKTDYLKEATKYDAMANNKFLKKLFLRNKRCFSEDQTSMEINDELVSDEKFLTEIFNEHYINILETTMLMTLDETTIGKIIDTYRHHPSVIAIKLSYTQNHKFNWPHATTQDINKIINSLSSSKVTGPGGIPLKFIKLSAN